MKPVLMIVALLPAASSAAAPNAPVPPAPEPAMIARVDPFSEQIALSDRGRPVLRYNYRTVEPGGVLDQVGEANLIYARPRSNYIHPLYGLHGEELTQDWSLDHPHHRGIYWAWPEVMVGDEMGDLHALQRIFARPTGRLKLTSGADFAEVAAESEWRWEDDQPVVREVAVIRAWRGMPEGRLIDLTFYLTALRDDVTLARRGTNAYGGLNIRLAPVADQTITFHREPTTAADAPTVAWADLAGTFPGAAAPSGLALIPHVGNPDYPGDPIQYPELNWFQLTFPAAETRYPVPTDQPLVLRYRLWVREGGPPDAAVLAERWRAYQNMPLLPEPELSERVEVAP